jgi:metal-sulfur cluster biosynthetic enzyme
MSDIKTDGVSQERILEALSHVVEPELHRDLVRLNMIRDITVAARHSKWNVFRPNSGGSSNRQYP